MALAYQGVDNQCIDKQAPQVAETNLSSSALQLNGGHNDACNSGLG